MIQYCLRITRAGEAYQTVRCPYYNLAGWPIENGIENQLYLMNGYRVVGAGEDTYVKCEKKNSG